MATPEQLEGQLDFGRKMADNMIGTFGHSWTMNILISALTHLVSRMVERNKSTPKEIVKRLQNAVTTIEKVYSN